MGDYRNPTARVDSLYRILGGLALTLHVARRILAEESVKRFFETLNIALLDEQLRKVHPPGQAFPAGLYPFQGHVNALLPEGISQLTIPIAPVFAFAPEPIDKLLRRRTNREVAKQV